MHPQVLPGLFLCGEVLDVFGRIGGFNFWWAWLSGRLAGQAAGVAAAAGAAASGKPAVAARGKQSP
jgi:predicted flavoprotein YhiN